MFWIELTKDYLGKKAGERLALDEKDAQPLIRSGIARAVPDDPLGGAIARGVDSVLAGVTKGLDQLITEVLKKFAAAQHLSHKNGHKIIFGVEGDGDSKKSFGDYLLAVARNDRVYLEKHYGSKFNEWQTKAALAEASGVTGGYTVPPDFYQSLLTLIVERSTIRPRAFVRRPSPG